LYFSHFHLATSKELSSLEEGFPLEEVTDYWKVLPKNAGELHGTIKEME
jgi:hypothetical protein